MIFLFTDFGASDVYVGQMHARLRRDNPTASVIDWLHQAPAFDVRVSAHLLAALAGQMQAGDVCVAVVDPGVGGARGALALHADERWFVGPDNGLLSVVAARARQCNVFHLDPDAFALSVSFHGRDLFAPVAARLARGEFTSLLPKARLDVEFGADELAQIIYLDRYGNAMTGLRAAGLARTSRLLIAGRAVQHARVFSDVPAGEAFWYENSIGLVEIACNQASAAERFGLRVGISVTQQG